MGVLGGDMGSTWGDTGVLGGDMGVLGGDMEILGGCFGRRSCITHCEIFISILLIIGHSFANVECNFFTEITYFNFLTREKGSKKHYLCKTLFCIFIHM